MDYDVVFVGDERNAVTVKDHRTGRPTTSWVSGSGRTSGPGNSRTVVVPPGARPTVITGGASQSGYYYPQYQQYPVYQQYPQFVGDPSQQSFAARFGMTTGELIDMGIQAIAAIQSLPAAPVAQGETNVDLENLMTYQSALWQAAKRDEQLRTLGGLLARILK